MKFPQQRSWYLASNVSEAVQLLRSRGWTTKKFVSNEVSAAAQLLRS